MIMNEKIKSSEVQLTGVNGEDLGVVPTKEALALAKKLKVDLVCTSLLSSPPPCRLIGAGAAKQAVQQASKGERKPKLKEIRLTPHIEAHDYDTKLQQALRMLKAGDEVALVVRIQGKEGAKSKELLERMLIDLKPAGTKRTGIQLSGKAALVHVYPIA